MPVTPQEFRDALARFASGVTIITTEAGGEKRGMTASAFLSVSLEPPLILVSVAKKAHMHAVLEAASSFAVNILSDSQQHLSNHFAGRPDAGLEIPWQELGGQPVLGGSLVQLACSRYATYDGGDHTLYVGQVEASQVFEGRPLGYFHGGYHELTLIPRPENA